MNSGSAISYRWYVPFAVGIGAGMAIAYSDIVPFLFGICSGLAIEHTQPGVCKYAAHAIASARRTKWTKTIPTTKEMSDTIDEDHIRDGGAITTQTPSLLSH